MTKEEVDEGNKLIAEFMGFKYFPFVEGSNIYPGWKTKEWVSPAIHGKTQRNCYLGRSHKDLKYHSSWDWLISVVEKIEKLDPGYTVYIFANRCTIYDCFYTPDRNPEKAIVSSWCGNYEDVNKIDPVYDAVVTFIKWYNQQKQ